MGRESLEPSRNTISDLGCGVALQTCSVMMHVLHAASFVFCRRHQFLVSQASAEALMALRAERDAANKKVESLQMALTSLKEDQERLQVISRLAVLDG